ncbi:CBS domain-containing protein [Bradymonas sediminis]|uniref:Uncharacterized protein n=1 Tax=Bradymonas sediminis TaxID=1548548 RepID=A0A2Z4FN98_9DELT|nr:CBS domain-containing protein [Bradymonas sediminis]AWV90330.1 hypothetical protein DN745_13725 [Bradymonas sediminis]TDP75693.1 nanoRNase/pAp phosphatase (c-di-AMP/oligoRNAs hydrolase) [Bradymonas sediminis]
MRVIITHANADLDAVASLVCARKLYGDAVCVRPRAVSLSTQRYLALHKDRAGLLRVPEVDAASVDEIVVVDVRNGRRLREYTEFFKTAKRVIVYDHHPASADDIEADEVNVEPVGSCATLLCERLQEAGIELNEWEATLALLGIYSDTGSLSFDGTTPRDIDAAAYLLRMGARLAVVNRYMRQRFTPEQFQLLTQMMGQLEEVSVDAVEIAISTGHAAKFVQSAAGVVEDVMRLGGHDAIFGVIGFDQGKRVQVVGRSRVPYINVGKILAGMGGGGHAGAGAASFKGRDEASVIAEIKEALNASDLSPTRVSDLMSSPVQTIGRDVSLGEAKALLERWNFSGAPVRSAESEEVCDAEVGDSSDVNCTIIDGIISRRDIARAEAGGNLHLPVASHMSHEVVAIPQDEPILDAFELMTQRDIGRLPVRDGGRLVGIITRSDILRRMYNQESLGLSEQK